MVETFEWNGRIFHRTNAWDTDEIVWETQDAKRDLRLTYGPSLYGDGYAFKSDLFFSMRLAAGVTDENASVALWKAVHPISNPPFGEYPIIRPIGAEQLS